MRKHMEKDNNKPINEWTANEFRKSATDADYDELYEYYCHNNDYKIWRDKEQCKYNFSYSFAQNVLIEKGYIEGNKKNIETANTNDNTTDILLNHMKWDKLNVKKSTVYLPTEIDERLNQVYSKYGCIPKQNILYALLDMALDEMGI